MAVTAGTRRDDAGRLGAAAAAVVVALAAVLTGVTLVRTGSGAGLDEPTALSGSGATAPGAQIDVISGPVPKAHSPLPAARPETLSIPAIGLATTTLFELGRTPEGVTEVPGNAASVGWLAEQGAPGERGATVLTGHVDFAYERGVYFHVPELRPGDTVTVGRQDGTQAHFTVYRVETLPRELALAHASAATGHPDLRLLTASGEFDDTLGRQADAVVVFTRLTGVTPAKSA